MIDSANSRSKNYLFVTFRSSGMETHLRISVFLDLFGLGLFLNSTYFLLFVSAMRFIDRFRNWLSDPITDFFFTSFTTLRLHCSGSCGTAFFLMLFTRHFWKMVYGRLVLRFAFNQTLNSDLALQGTTGNFFRRSCKSSLYTINSWVIGRFGKPTRWVYPR